MSLDWSTFWMIVAVLAAAVVGGWANHWFENREKLVTFISHTAALKAKIPNGKPLTVHTHSIVVRNAGKKSAKNVRIGHSMLPDYNVYPSMAVSEETLPDSSVDLVFPVLRPQEQVIVSYLYYPPVVFSQINTHVKSDEDQARFISVMPSRQPSRPMVRTAWGLMFIGGCTLLFLAYTAVTHVLIPLWQLTANQM